MRVIVTAPALVLTPGPGSPVLKLTPEEARLRRLCMEPLGDGFYRVKLENHFKKGTLVEFQGDVPKIYASSVAQIGPDGKAVETAAPAQPVRAADPQAGKTAQKTPTAEFDSMTKAQLLDFAETHHINVDASMTKAELQHALKSRTAA